MGAHNGKEEDSNLPPEVKGLPIIGKGIEFDISPVNFIEKNSQQLGSIFRSEIVGQEMAFLVGNTAVNSFMNEENVTRADPVPYMVQILAGGEKRITPFLDGKAHVRRRNMLAKMLTDESLDDYLPVYLEIFENVFPPLATEAQFSSFKSFCRCQAQFIGRIVGGLPKKWVDDNTDELVKYFDAIAAGLDSKVPVAIPFTAFGTALKEENKWIAILEESVRQREKQFYDAKKDPSSLPKDFVTHLVVNNDKLEVHEQLSVPLIARELVHLTIANYGVASLLTYATLALASNLKVREKIMAEVTATIGKKEHIKTSDLQAMTYTNMFLRETLRFYPIVPILSGSAAKDFTCDGFTVKKGWKVMVGVFTTNRDPKVYNKPNAFDPERFSEERAEDKKAKFPLSAYIPQGGGDPAVSHRCLGEMFSRNVAKFYITHLLTHYDFNLISEQNVSIDFNRFALIPFDGVIIKMTKKH